MGGKLVRRYIQAYKLDMREGGIEFISAPTAGLMKEGTEASPESLGTDIPASGVNYEGLGIFIQCNGAAGRIAGVNEDHGVYAYMLNAGSVYFQFGVQGNAYTSGKGRESYGIFGRARVKSGGNMGEGSTGALIGVCGVADVVSGGTLDITGAGIMAGGRFEYRFAGTFTSGYRCALFAQVVTGTADSVLYLLVTSGTTVSGVIEMNIVGTATSAFDFHNGVDGTVISAYSALGSPTHNIAVNIQGIGVRYIKLYDTK